MLKSKIRILPFYKTKECYRYPWCGATFTYLPPECNKYWTLRRCGTFIMEAE